MPKDKNSEIRKKIIKAYEENEYANVMQNRNRARSLNVGTAFGGIVEVSMRGDYHHLWCPLQPVEVVEVIEQLAASAGLQIAIRPRQDFATWRGWNTDDDHRYWAGSASWQLPKIKELEEQRLLESEEIKKLPQGNKKKASTKKIRKKIDDLNESTNNDITKIMNDLENTIESLDKKRLEDFANQEESINLSHAVKHIENMREILQEEFDEQRNSKKIEEFIELLDEKYSE